VKNRVQPVQIYSVIAPDDPGPLTST